MGEHLSQAGRVIYLGGREAEPVEPDLYIGGPCDNYIPERTAILPHRFDDGFWVRALPPVHG